MDIGALTVGQEALWFLHQLAPESSAYNTSSAVRIHSGVDVDIMAEAVRRIVSGHRMLNCVFRSAGGEVRRVRADLDPVLEVHDLAMDDPAFRTFALALAQRPFRLDRELPIRFGLLRRADRPDVLLMAAHHIVIDNISQLLVIGRVLAEYSAVATGAERPGGETGGDFDEFVRRERTYLASNRARLASAFWRGELADLPAEGLPTDLPRPDVYRFAGSEVDFELPASVMAAVAGAAARRNMTVFAYLFAAFQLLLASHGGQTDFVVGYPVTLRPGRRLRESIGYFVNTLPFRARVDPGDSFDALLERTGTRLWRGLAHRDYPLAMMPRLVDVPRAAGHAGLISTMFVIAEGGSDDPVTAMFEPGSRTEYAGLSISEFYLPQQQGQFDITLQLQRHAGGARAQVKYNTSLFTAETAQQLASRYGALLRSAVDGTLPATLGKVAAVTDHRR